MLQENMDVLQHKKYVKIRCSVKHCPSYRPLGGNTSGKRFFSFPRPDDVARVLQWKLACSDERIMKKDPASLNLNNRICSDHFESHFMITHKLKKDAAPTLNLFLKPSTTDVGTQTEGLDKIEFKEGIKITHSETQTTLDISSCSPRKNKLRTLLKSKSKIIRKLNMDKLKFERCFQTIGSQENQITKDEFKKACSVHLPEFLGNLARTVCDLKDRKLRGRRYTQEFKQHALGLYYSGPKTYRKMVQNYFFPSVSTLRRMTENVQKTPGLNNFIFRSLKLRLQGKSKEDRICILTMDEVSLKVNLQYDQKSDEIIGFHDLGRGKTLVPAKNALVLMARGIHDNWKQPLGFFFITSNCNAADLKIIVFDCIGKMLEAGLDVRAVISDMGSNFVLFSKQLGVNLNNCVFQVHGRNLVYIFDTPHLIKCMRNVLLKYEVELDGKVASWKYIEELYHREKEHDLKMAVKLTDAHIYPTTFQRMKVKYAVQVLSSTVVSALSTYIANGQMDAAAAGTAHFLEKFDHLFDILNSSKKAANQFRRPYVGSLEQEQFLLSMIDSLKTMKVFSTTTTGRKNVTGTFKMIDCFQITIKSIMILWDNLKNEGMSQLSTRRLNQDCLENFFGKIRQQGGNSVNPTPYQFMHAFKKLSCMDLLDCAQTFNCAADVDSLLLMSQVDLPLPVEQRPIAHEINTFKITNTDFRKNDLPTRNVEQYISGYLLRKCLKKHSCLDCQNYASKTEVLDSTNLFSHFKGATDKYGRMRDSQFGKLLMPDERFVNYISILEGILIANVRSVATGMPARKLFELLRVIPFEHPCPQFPHIYLITLFIRMRIFYIVKYANQNFRSDEYNKRKLRKLQILMHQ